MAHPSSEGFLTEYSRSRNRLRVLGIESKRRHNSHRHSTATRAQQTEMQETQNLLYSRKIIYERILQNLFFSTMQWLRQSSG
jgi:hypothetical protein